MAIPGDTLSSAIVAPANFIEGRATVGLSATLDYETGGVALNDPSEGHQVQVWKTKVSDDGTRVLISALNHTESILYTGTDITEVSLSFDQNMRPQFAFVEDGQAKFEWYDSQIADRVLTILAADVITPRVTLDDKRIHELAFNDVLLFYIRGTNLYMQRQRDRYTIEYLMGATPIGHNYLAIVGMSDVNRLLFEFRAFIEDTEIELTLESALAIAADGVTLPGDESQPATGVTFDAGSSTIYKPDNEEE